MKKVCLLVIGALIFFGCSAEKSLKMTIKNTSQADHVDEMVSISWNKITEKLNLKDAETFIVLNEEGKQIPYQILYNGKTAPQSVIFPATAMIGEKVIYQIKKGQPQTFDKKTFGRSVPERKDDFAWENDRIAFRMYGPALAPENPSNGVDLWLKKTNDLVVDKFYNDDLKNGLSYHIDHGLGLDCYKVGHTLGAGGAAPFKNDSLLIGGPYSTAKVLDSGPLRTTFELTYDSVPFIGKKITEKIVISLDAYSQFSKATVSYDGDFDSFDVAGGFWLHAERGNIDSKPESGYIAYAENASDSKVPAGRTCVGVIFPNGMKSAIEHANHLIGLAEYKKGDQFTYYFGAGWSDWGFKTDDAWFNYVDKFTTKLKTPLSITIE